MAVQKVNSEAESSHIAVINKVAGIAISPSYGAHNKNMEVFLKNKKKNMTGREKNWIYGWKTGRVPANPTQENTVRV